MSKNRSNQNKLRKQFIESPGVEYKCSRCGISGWFQEQIKGNYFGYITLQLDHKDGDNNNNKFENLHLLCPNCHVVKTHREKPFLVFKNNKFNTKESHNINIWEFIKDLVKKQPIDNKKLNKKS